MNWNISKLSTLRQCHRKFYFAYEIANFHYTYPYRRKAFELSQMKSLKMWRGSLIDYAMTKQIVPLIKERQKLDFVKIADELVGLAKRQFEFSKNGYYRMTEIPRSDAGDDFLILDIHEARVAHESTDISALYQSIHKIITDIPGYPSPENGMNLLEYLTSASFLRPDVRNFKYEFDGIKVIPQIDLVRYLKKSIHVIDWKVSDSDTADFSRQLTLEGVVALHYGKKWFLKNNWVPLPSLEDVKLFQINLLDGSVTRYPFTKESTAIALDYVYSYRHEQEQLSQQKKWSELDIEDYERTDKAETCAICKFKPLCKHLIISNFIYNENEYHKLVQSRKLA